MGVIGRPLKKLRKEEEKRVVLIDIDTATKVYRHFFNSVGSIQEMNDFIKQYNGLLQIIQDKINTAREFWNIPKEMPSYSQIATEIIDKMPLVYKDTMRRTDEKA